MTPRAPHFLLYSETRGNRERGDWRFVLQAADGSAKLEAADEEPHMQGERLELLAAVRGLEALDQPSHVTLVTPSKYVSRGIQQGLEEWRANDWQWESFGELVPIKNLDLWRRIDRALAFHHVECRNLRIDEGHLEPAGPVIVHSTLPPAAAAARPDAAILAPTVETTRVRRRSPRRASWKPTILRARRAVSTWLAARFQKLAQCGTCLLPCPWLDS